MIAGDAKTIRDLLYMTKPLKYIEDITRWREDTNFMFEWQEQYLIHSPT